MRNVVTGVAWYRREQWMRLREVAADAEELEKTYDDWEAMALDGLRRMHSRGIEPVRVDIDVEELIRWCQAEQRPLDSSARAAFASLKLSRQNERH